MGGRPNSSGTPCDAGHIHDIAMGRAKHVRHPRAKRQKGLAALCRAHFPPPKSRSPRSSGCDAALRATEQAGGLGGALCSPSPASADRPFKHTVAHMSVPPPAPPSRTYPLRFTRTLPPIRAPHDGPLDGLPSDRVTSPALVADRDLPNITQPLSPLPPLLRRSSDTGPRLIPTTPAINSGTLQVCNLDTCNSADKTASAYSADHPFYSYCSLLYEPRDDSSSIDAPSYNGEFSRRLLLTTSYGNGSLAQFEAGRSVPRWVGKPSSHPFRVRSSEAPVSPLHCRISSRCRLLSGRNDREGHGADVRCLLAPLAVRREVAAKGPRFADAVSSWEHAPCVIHNCEMTAGYSLRHKRSRPTLVLIAETADHDLDSLAA